jgi:hypothetical protein
MRYNPWKNGVVRFSAGRGKRSANILPKINSFLQVQEHFRF